MTTPNKIYTPEDAGSGQWGVCIKCNLGPTEEGHDGCLGTLPYPVMNACCGHGADNQAYIQYWDGEIIRGDEALSVQKRFVDKRGDQR